MPLKYISSKNRSPGQELFFKYKVKHFLFNRAARQRNTVSMIKDGCTDSTGHARQLHTEMVEHIGRQKKEYRQCKHYMNVYLSVLHAIFSH